MTSPPAQHQVEAGPQHLTDTQLNDMIDRVAHWTAERGMVFIERKELLALFRSVDQAAREECAGIANRIHNQNFGTALHAARAILDSRN